jgi:hypothetical protein
VRSPDCVLASAKAAAVTFRVRLVASAAACLLLPLSASAGELSDARVAALVAAYPEQLERIDGADLVWRDGTRMRLDDGKGQKTLDAWLEEPDIEDMLRFPYPAATEAVAPGRDIDPGRARNAAFFEKMYGDCRKGEVATSLAEIVWLAGKAPRKLRVTRINRVDERLAAVSAELDRLPDRFDVYLTPSAGTYNCRVIAGTDRVSAHGYAIAIDIAVARSHYWRNVKPEADGGYLWRNAIPREIVDIFERHGFIWGGRWYHYDTMHFEYRPELMPRPGAP